MTTPESPLGQETPFFKESANQKPSAPVHPLEMTPDTLEGVREILMELYSHWAASTSDKRRISGVTQTYMYIDKLLGSLSGECIPASKLITVEPFGDMVDEVQQE